MGAFADSIRSNSDKMLKTVNRQIYSIAFELFTSIVLNSPSPSNPGPFADGLLVNQWYPAIGDFSTQVGGDTSPNGSNSLSRIKSVMSGSEFYRKNGRLTLANNLDYAYRAEVLGWPKSDGYSGKSGAEGKGKPYRMVAKSLQAVVARYK